MYKTNYTFIGVTEVIEKFSDIVREEEKHLFMMDVMRYVLTSSYKYDIIYADPPFNMEGKVELAKKIASRKMLKEHGLFIIHYPEEEKKLWPNEIEGFIFKDERKYGRSMVRFYEVAE